MRPAGWTKRDKGIREGEKETHLTLWRRHKTTCKHKGDRYYRKCRCMVWCEGTIRGEYIRKSLKTPSWEDAIDLARTIEDGITPPQPEESITIKDALAAFIKDCEVRQLGSATLRKYKLVRDRLTEFCEASHKSQLRQLEADSIRLYRQGRSLGSLTASKELGHLRTFFAFCISNDWISKNPAKAIKEPKFKINPRLPFSEKEIQNILSKAEDDRELAFILTLRHTGLRIGDASLLKVSQVSDGRIYLYTAKSGTPVSILIPDSLLNLLKKLPPKGGHFFLRGESTHPHTASDLWRKRIKAICKELGILPDHPHRFRHFLACDLLSKGVSIESVAAILGNSAAIVQKHYSQFVKQRQDALDQAIALTHTPQLVLVKKS